MSTASTSGRAWIGRRDVLISALATLASLYVHGYSFGLQNQHIQIPHLLALQDPGLFSGDPLIEAMASYFSYFWPAMAWLTERLPLEPTFFGLHLAVVFARFLGLSALARGIWPQAPGAPLVVVWLVFFGHSGIGYESLNWTYLAHTTLATALGLWALAAAVRGRVLATALLAGLLFDLHAMQSAYVLLMAGAAFLVAGDVSWRRLLSATAIYSAAAAPGLVWLYRSGGLAAPAEFDELVRTYFPYHFFPSSFAAAQWLALVAYVGAFAAGVWVLGKDPHARRALAMAGALLVFWALGGTLIELWPSAFLIKLHVFRSSAYLYCVLAALFAGVITSWLGSVRRIDPRLLTAILAAGTVVPAGLPFVRHPLWLAAALGLAGLGLAAALRLSSARARRVCAGLALVSSVVAGGYALFERGVAARRLPLSQEPWHETQRWVEANTPADALFLTPPYISGFRVHSRRAVVGEVQDGSAILWSATYAEHWRRWFERMAGPIDGEPVTSWDRLAREWFARDQAQIEALGREFGADYVVIREPREREADLGWGLEWSGEALYDNGIFAVYELRD